MEDQELIALYWNREETAITQTAEQYGSYCYAIAWNLLGDRQDSEECVSDTWLRAWQNIPPHRPLRLTLFLGKITRNLSLDRLRKRKAEKRGCGQGQLLLEELAECLPSPNTVSQVAEDRELSASINRFLHQLSSRDCHVFLARYWYGHTIKEIGVFFSMTENAVKVCLHRTRNRLKLHLEKEGLTV